VRGRGEGGMCLLVKFKDGVSTFEFVGFKYNCTLLVKVFSRIQFYIPLSVTSKLVHVAKQLNVNIFAI
jgi:hypothetical protein